MRQWSGDATVTYRRRQCTASAEARAHECDTATDASCLAVCAAAPTSIASQSRTPLLPRPSRNHFTLLPLQFCATVCRRACLLGSLRPLLRQRNAGKASSTRSSQALQVAALAQPSSPPPFALLVRESGGV